ncbi:hypothetical protein NDU88_000873 [Pleurodeles waltl]|uniref:Uncharacterized protein n=1 Tax=Pleurodeles waltl TaxID=8319 RepID=A0AAV7S5R9_PLEWA|nr:hypothetical protein NDU88_000873 [Pleurodeles waltl]
MPACVRASQSVRRQRVRSALCTVCYSLAAAHVVVSVALLLGPAVCLSLHWCGGGAPPQKSLSCCALGVDPELKPASECEIGARERGDIPLAPSCCVGATYYTDVRPVGAQLRKARMRTVSAAGFLCPRADSTGGDELGPPEGALLRRCATISTVFERSSHVALGALIYGAIGVIEPRLLLTPPTHTNAPRFAVD